MTENGYNCMWFDNKEDCNRRAVREFGKIRRSVKKRKTHTSLLVCGKHHASVWGSTGYDSGLNHWCNLDLPKKLTAVK